MSFSRFFNSILAAPGASLLPTLCSAADTRVFALFIPAPLSFASLQIRFTPSAPSFTISSGSGAAFNTILPLTAFRSPYTSLYSGK